MTNDNSATKEAPTPNNEFFGSLTLVRPIPVDPFTTRGKK